MAPAYTIRLGRSQNLTQISALERTSARVCTRVCMCVNGQSNRALI